MKVLKKIDKSEAAVIDKRYTNSIAIRFDSIGGGFVSRCSPYNCFDIDNLRYGHTFDFNVFAGGTTHWDKQIDKKEMEQFHLPKEERQDTNAFTKKQKEMTKVLESEIFKAADRFDKEIQSIMKKYGYIKRKD